MQRRPGGPGRESSLVDLDHWAVRDPEERYRVIDDGLAGRRPPGTMPVSMPCSRQRIAPRSSLETGSITSNLMPVPDIR
jgi:hypothetical protein